MLAGLCHHSVVAGNNQQDMADPADTRQHIAEKLFMARHIHKADNRIIILRPVGIAEVDGHSAFFLFRQMGGIHAGYRLNKSRFSVVNMAGCSKNHGNSACKSRFSSSRQRRSHHRRPSLTRPITGMVS